MAVRDFQEFISHFDVKRKTGNRYQCKCPCHTDKKASLTVTDAKDKVLVKCHAGCKTTDILQTVGLGKSDLFYGQNKDSTYQEERWKVYAEGRISQQEGRSTKITKRYDHIDLDGNYVCSKLRCHPKTFRWAVIKDDFVNLSLPKQKKDMPSFYCPNYTAFKKAIQDGKTVYYCEGCKDVDTLYKHGYLAISCGGSGDWNSAIAEAFTDAKVIIFADNDDAGMKLSGQVYRDLVKVAEDVQIVKPCTELKGGDISDLIALHGVKALHRVARFDKYQFHLYTEKRDKETGEITKKVSGVYDYEIFKYLKLTRTIIVCGNLVYMYQDGIFVPDLSGAKLKSAIRDLIFPQHIKSNTIKRIYDLFLSADELQMSPEDFNQQPAEWVCFQNGYFDPISKRMISHNPKYRTVNQLPHEYHPEDRPKGELTESWLNSVMGSDEREMTLQYAGYCCTTDITQQKYMIITGIGGTGKSTLINLLEFMIGFSNVSGVALDELSHRFVGYDLMWKLLNCNADLKIDVLDDASTVKKMSGEDTIKGEPKGKQPVYFKSYAKHIFSTNQMPVIKEERSDAFYRRLLILPMNKKPKKQDPTFSKRLQEEINYLIHLCMDALGRLYESGLIHEAESSVKAVRQLRQDSDVTQAFLDAKTIQDADSKVLRTELFSVFEDYCRKAERQPLTKNNFFKAMRAKGIAEVKSSGDWYFKGISCSKSNGSCEWLEVAEDDTPFI